MNELDSHSRQILACLGDASRFRLVHSLLQREQCVSELAVSVGLSQSCTTRHLQYLEREGVVRGVRQGKRVMFRLRSDLPRVRALLAWVTAASHDAVRGQLSGADVHLERPVPTTGSVAPTGGRELGRSEQPVRRARGDRSAHAPRATLPAGGEGREGAGRANPPSEGKRFRSNPAAGQPPAPGGRRRAAPSVRPPSTGGHDDPAGADRPDQPPGGGGPDVNRGVGRSDQPPAGERSGSGASPSPAFQHGEDLLPRSDLSVPPPGGNAHERGGGEDQSPAWQNQTTQREPVDDKPLPPASIRSSPMVGKREMEDWLL